jgi:UDP-glucose 4-epimerase
MHKLETNPNELEVLGDGTQTKSYMYIGDCVEAMLHGLERSEDVVGIFNIGSDDQIDVKSIARIVIEEMGLKNVHIHFTGGVDGGRGWKGDVKKMLLDINRIRETGWEPRYSSEESIRLTVRAEKGSIVDTQGVGFLGEYR